MRTKQIISILLVLSLGWVNCKKENTTADGKPKIPGFEKISVKVPVSKEKAELALLEIKKLSKSGGKAMGQGEIPSTTLNTVGFLLGCNLFQISLGFATQDMSLIFDAALGLKAVSERIGPTIGGYNWYSEITSIADALKKADADFNALAAQFILVAQKVITASIIVGAPDFGISVGAGTTIYGEAIVLMTEIPTEENISQFKAIISGFLTNYGSSIDSFSIERLNTVMKELKPGLMKSEYQRLGATLLMVVDSIKIQ